MGTIIRKKTYRCSDDCRQSGCPGHEAIFTYQSVSDAYVFENGKGETKYFERGELEAFIELLKGLDRADAVQV
jgi:hypothetical protein